MFDKSFLRHHVAGLSPSTARLWQEAKRASRVRVNRAQRWDMSKQRDGEGSGASLRRGEASCTAKGSFRTGVLQMADKNNSLSLGCSDLIVRSLKLLTGRAPTAHVDGG
jgi:hypothetical protein